MGKQLRLASCTVHGMCGKRGIGEFLKDQQELQLRCLLQQEKKWRCVDRPVDALGLTNESPLSCFPCVLCFSSFYLTSPCKTWTFYLLKWFGTWQRSCPVFQKKSNLNPLSKEKYTCKPHVPLHKTTTISKTTNISYKLCTHVLQLPYSQTRKNGLGWTERK